MSDYSNLDIKKVVVFGGTGAQGSSIVKREYQHQYLLVYYYLSDTIKELSEAEKFIITIPTRNTESASAAQLAKLKGVGLLDADYESEEGLRKAFAGQDACYFNINSFTVGEPYEYFWTFRAYEIAVQSKLKWFVLSGGPDRLKQYGYEEKYRNSHGTVKAKISDWLSHQPLDILPWTILYGGVYAQMLSSLLQPKKGPDGVYHFIAPIANGSIPFVDLDDYGVRTRYVFENPAECVGKSIGWGAWYTSYPELIRAFKKATGNEAVFHDLTQEEWFEKLRPYVDAESRLPKGVSLDDRTAFTFRRTFGAWWNLWKDGDNIRDKEQEKRNRDWSDKVYPGRCQNIEEWMIKSKYTGKWEILMFF